MQRRDFFLPRAKTNTNMPSPTGALDPYTGPWTDREVTHLLRRILFGVKKEYVSQFKTAGLTQAVNLLLQTDTLPSPPVNVYSTAQKPDPFVPFGSTFVNDPLTNLSTLPPEYIQARVDALKAWWVGNMIKQNPNITEKLTLFWHNHFAIEADAINIAQAIHQYYVLLRTNALGNFKTFTKDITLLPAMLYYLNGGKNSATAPDENYARELQELFTVGKGPDSKFTEDDVKAIAKVLTGFRINPFTTPISNFFDFTAHDTSVKTLSAFYGNKSVQGKFGAAGATELDDLLTIIFDNIETARHILRKIYQFFVYYEIDATTEQQVIRPLADAFKQNGYNIKPILATLFTSQHFYDMMQQGCVIKNPLDFVLGIVKEFDIQLPNNAAPITNQYLAWGSLASYSAYQGLNIADPLNVSGWQAWYQAPLFHEVWINADSLASRNRLVEILTSPTGIDLTLFTIKNDPTLLAKKLSDPYTADTLVKDAVSFLYNVELSKTSYDYFKSFLISGYPDESYWNDAWRSYILNPNDAAIKNNVTIRLNSLFREIILQAEYQLS